MPTVTETIKQGGTAVQGVKVTARLVAHATDEYAPGYVTGATILDTRTATTDAAGVWSMALDANGLVTPAGTIWNLAYKLPRSGARPDPKNISVRTPRTVTDAVLNSTTTLTSATAVFVAGDVGRSVTGTGIPTGTSIASRTSATSVILSAAATATATGVTVEVDGTQQVSTLLVITPGELSLVAVLDNLADVSVAAPTSGFALAWNGTAWVPTDVTSVGAAAIPKATGTTAGDSLVWTAASTPVRLAEGLDGQAAVVNTTAAARRAWRFLGPPGPRVVLIGDSTGLGHPGNGSNTTPPCSDRAWITHGCAQSGLQLVANVSVFGNTTAQMLARFDTDVAVHNPEIVFIASALNDVNGGVAQATTLANILAMVGKARRIGAHPVVCLTTPRGTGNVTNVIPLNRMILRQGRQYGYQVLDFYSPLVDPVAQSMKATYMADPATDTSHLSYAAAQVLGQVVANWANTAGIRDSSWMLTPSDTDAGNKFPNGTFSAGGGTVAPTGFTNYNFFGSGITFGIEAPVAGEGIVGNWAALTAVGAGNGVRGFTYPVTIGWSVGDILRLGAVIDTPGLTGGGKFNVQLVYNGSALGRLPLAFEWTGPFTGVVWAVTPLTGIPAGTTTIDFYFTMAGTGTGTAAGKVRIAQLTQENLTTAGWTDEA